MSKSKSLVVKEPFRTDVAGAKFTLFEGEAGGFADAYIAQVPVDGYSAAAVERARRWAHRLAAAPDLEEALDAMIVAAAKWGLAASPAGRELLSKAGAALAKAKGGGG